MFSKAIQKKQPLEGDLPGSPAGAAYAQVAQQLVDQHGRRGQVLVSSPQTGAGRTVTAANLSLALMRKGLSVLLVELTDGEPDLESVFGTSPYRTGIESVLAGKQQMDAIVCRRADNGLYLAMMKGATALDLHAPERLASAKGILTYAAERFDWTVVDGPSYAEESSVSLLASLVSQLVVVCHRRLTRASALAFALKSLQPFHPYVLLTA